MQLPSRQPRRRTSTRPLGPGACTLAVLLLATAPAAAHTGSPGGGFLSGVGHPLFGADHVVAMVAVGLWGRSGAPAIYTLPIVFPLVMALGGVLGILGVPLPGPELAIAASAVVLGAMVALAARPPLWVAAAIVGAFAIFHGYAHGAELPAGADAVAYSLGFVVATGLLHLRASRSASPCAGRRAASACAAPVWPSPARA